MWAMNPVLVDQISYIVQFLLTDFEKYFHVYTCQGHFSNYNTFCLCCQALIDQNE